MKLPALRVLQTVGNRELFSLQGVQIIFKMGVQGEYHFPLPVRLIGPDLLRHRLHDGSGFRGSQGTVYKIILHIHYYQ